MGAIKRLDEKQIELLEEREILERNLPGFLEEADKLNHIVHNMKARLQEIKLELKNRREGQQVKTYKKDGPRENARF